METAGIAYCNVTGADDVTYRFKAVGIWLMWPPNETEASRRVEHGQTTECIRRGSF